MIYDPYDWERARCQAAKLLLLAQYDLDEFGYFNECAILDGECSYCGECGIEYCAINPANPDQEPMYTFNDSITACKYANGCLIGRLSPSVALMRRCKECNLRDKVQGVIRIFTDFENDCLTYPEVERVTCNDLTITDLSIPICKYTIDNRCQYIRCFDVIVWQHWNYGLLIDGSINPCTEAQLQLNGQDRQSKRSGFWHDTVEPYMYHTDTPRDGVNVFSFALNPEEHQPSGTCNFSRIDTAQLNLWFFEFCNNRYCDVFNDCDNKVLIFAVNYNVLRIMSGMGGLAYSN